MKVYHRISPDFFAEHKPNKRLEDYQLVAEVDCATIEQAFELTNHIHCAWQENSEVYAYSKNARSTSVGDVVVDDNGTIYWCKDVGWEEV